jgi:alkanesulfonate monooxygenase SsuD/methylene tetrahydromethanopterin reductase-like flavin-dependent oxidoreductase (luciferase family)
MTLTLQDVAGGRFVSASVQAGSRRSSTRSVCPSTIAAARVDETLTILRTAWSGDVFSHEGQLFSFGNVQLTTRTGACPAGSSAAIPN